jgi:hypothetical protein
VECTPLLAPKVYDTAALVLAGKPVDKRIVVEESLFDQSNVTADVVAGRKY